MKNSFIIANKRDSHTFFHTIFFKLKFKVINKQCYAFTRFIWQTIDILQQLLSILLDFEICECKIIKIIPWFWVFIKIISMDLLQQYIDPNDLMIILEYPMRSMKMTQLSWEWCILILQFVGEKKQLNQNWFFISSFIRFI